jgi:hypothetical protein
MKQFNIGDTVRCIAQDETIWGFLPNHTYKVVKVREDDIGLSAMDGSRPVAQAGSKCWYEHKCYFEVDNHLSVGEICTVTGRRGVKPYESN